MPIAQRRTNVLVLGAGLAGLSAALAAAREGAAVVLAHPGPVSQTASVRAQGGVAAAIGPDDGPARHAGDTLAVGGDLVDPAMAWLLTSTIPQMVDELVRLGFHPDRQPDGALELGLEAGHSRHRIVHAGGAASGRAIWEALASAVQHESTMHEVRRARVVELAVADGQCIGAYLMTAAGPMAVSADSTVLATGGYAALYDRTAGPQSAIGSGCAIAYRAGAELADLEFVQFHPTALDQPGRPAFLLSEALRGAGAQLINSRGERFMPSIHPNAELAPRDSIARAVAQECRSGPVFLTLSHLDPLKIHARFPNLSRRLAHRGLDLAADLLPVRPAAHFSIGGILVDRDGRTTLPGLFAVGEVACSGLHGANRLASNALGECLVFGTRGGFEAARSVAARRDGRPEPRFEPPADFEARRAPLALRSSMTEFAGIERSGNGLHHLLNWLDQHLPTGTSWETWAPNAWLISALIARAGLARAESRGSHYRIDYPAPSPDMVGRFVHRRGESLEFRPISNFGASMDLPAFQEVIR